MSLTVAYLIVIVGVVVWSFLLAVPRQVPHGAVQWVTVFGGAFLLGSCFVNLVPHMFLSSDGQPFVVGAMHFKVAGAVLVGFMLQMLLEQMTGGVEHGHDHGAASVAGVMIGLSLHALLEGMPLADAEGDVHLGLLYGIVLHNIPISIILLSIFASHGYGALRSMLLLLLFALMTPIGSIANLHLMPAGDAWQRLVMGLVVGILLHVSVSILFAAHGSRRWATMLVVLLAFVAAYFTPACSEIYSAI